MKKKSYFPDKPPIQHLFQNLYISLKETSFYFRIIFGTIAYYFDELYHRGTGFLMSCFPKYSSDIDFFAQERGIKRIKYESDDTFKERVINAYCFLKSSSTLEGLKAIIHNASHEINPDFSIRELYKENWILGEAHLGIKTTVCSQSTSLYFIVDFGNTLIMLDKYNYLSELINLYKPAHVGFRINARILDNWDLGLEKEQLGETTYLTN